VTRRPGVRRLQEPETAPGSAAVVGADGPERSSPRGSGVVLARPVCLLEGHVAAGMDLGGLAGSREAWESLIPLLSLGAPKFLGRWGAAACPVPETPAVAELELGIPQHRSQPMPGFALAVGKKLRASSIPRTTGCFSVLSCPRTALPWQDRRTRAGPGCCRELDGKRHATPLRPAHSRRPPGEDNLGIMKIRLGARYGEGAACCGCRAPITVSQAACYTSKEPADSLRPLPGLGHALPSPGSPADGRGWTRRSEPRGGDGGGC